MGEDGDPSEQTLTLGRSAPAPALPAILGHYEVGPRLGAGGMGVVFEAFDRELQRPVALKLLPRMDPEAVRSFKVEFRQVALLAHRNLVAMHEFIATDSHCFFTMERVTGVPLSAHLGCGAAVPLARTVTNASPEPRPEEDAPRAPLEKQAEARIRAAFSQLALGVSVLHDAGLMHLDLKPSNVLVEEGGRVVVLDFGIARLIEETPVDRRGTPQYMAPEQARGGALTPAADWYAVGVMLFQALTGQLPARHLEPRPSRLRAGVPDDLDRLCAALLALDAEGRPLADEVLAVLPAGPRLGRSRVPFIGRSAELRMLRDRYAGTGAAWVHVRGPSGSGKTALVEELLRSLDASALILRGRCYERELGLYKGLDTVMDTLVGWLASLGPRERQPLLPPGLEIAAQLFPALGSLITAAAPLPAVGAVELRALAFAAVTELMARVSSARRVVVSIDDLQWADRDTGRLLTELLTAGGRAPMLFVGTWRLRSEETSRLLDELRRASGNETSVLELGPLDAADARTLAGAILPPGNEAEAAAISERAAGNPLFIELLAEAGAGGGQPGSPAELLAERLKRLEAGERRLLQVVALAGKPITQRLAVAAALDGSITREMAALRASRLIVTAGPRVTDPIDCYHDGLRTLVVGALGRDEERALHRRLAGALEGEAPSAHEDLAVHWLGAEEPLQAGTHARLAAAAAAAALAFDRQAELLRLALECTSVEAERRDLLKARGDALVNAGRSAEAAPLFLDAARGLEREQQLDLERRSAEAFLVAGRTEEGLSVCEPLLVSVGLPPLRRGISSLVGLLLELFRLRWRRLAFVPAASGEGDALLRIDLAWSIGRGLINILPIEGTRLITRSIRLALDLRDGARVGRGLAYLSSGVVGARQAASYQRRAEELAAGGDDPHLSGILAVARAAWSVGITGEWQHALGEADRGVEILRARCTGVNWERTVGSSAALMALEMMGRFREYGERASAHLREATGRGDFYGQMSFGPYVALHQIVCGNVARCRETADEIARGLARDAYTVHHFYVMRLHALCDLYEGRAEAAWARFRQDWPKIRSAGMLYVSQMRLTILLLGAQLRLAVAASGDAPPSLLGEAARAAKRIAREARADARAQARLIEAATVCRTRRDLARELLAEASASMRASDMQLAAACADWQAARLAGDEPARRRAEAEIAGCGVVDPARWAMVQCPGFPAQASAPPADTVR